MVSFVAGFTLETWIDLRDAIWRLADSTDAVEDNSNEYGTFFRVEGMLVGPTAMLPVTLVWMQRATDKRFHFVTLKPRKERRP